MKEETDLKKMGMFQYTHIRELLSNYIRRNDNRCGIFDAIADFEHEEAYCCWLPGKKVAAMTNPEGQYIYLCHGEWKMIDENKEDK